MVQSATGLLNASRRLRSLRRSVPRPGDSRREEPSTPTATLPWSWRSTASSRPPSPVPGDVGAILLPDEDAVLRAFNEDGKFQFTQEIQASAVSGLSPWFASGQEKFTIGFPRYRIFFYNTTDRTVGVNLYVYLTN